MRQVRVAELKDGLSRVLRSVEAGETVEVLDRARPIARLSPIEAASRGTTAITRAPRQFAEVRARGFALIAPEIDGLDLLADERDEPDWFASR